MKQLLTALVGLILALPANAQDDWKPEPGYTSLFNGKDLTGWVQKNKDKEDLTGKTVTPNKKFMVEGGIIKVTGGGGGDLYTAQSFDRDFNLKMEFRAAPKADSGVFIRGPQLQVRDYPTVGPYKVKSFKNGDWNELDITAQAGIVSTVVNGKTLTEKDSLTLTVENGKPVAKLNGKPVDVSKIECSVGAAARCVCNGEVIEKAFKIGAKGGIGLQTETGNFEFRRIRIKLALPGNVDGEFSSAPIRTAEGEPKKKRLLLITESRGFVHSVVNRPVTLTKGVTLEQFPKMEGLEATLNKEKKLVVLYRGRIEKPVEIKAGSEVLAVIKPCLVETTFMKLAKETGMFDVVCSQNSRQEISSDALKNYDAIFFYTTMELPLSDTQKSDLLAFVKNGKGFGGSHCATDTLYQWKEYGNLIGAYFDGHPWHQKIRVIVEDKTHASTKHLGDSFEITDEIYQFRAPYDRSKLHVLMKLDMDSVKNPGKRADKDNALAWTHEFGKGRVFYTALGHREEVWNDPRFQQHVIGGLRYMFGMEK